jgi:hypothetical protein
MKNHNTSDNPWKLFWLGVNATGAGASTMTAAVAVGLSAHGDIKPSATGATIGLLIALTWLVSAIRAVRSEERFPGGLFWFAISGTLGAAGSIAAAAAMDLTQKNEAADPGGLGPLGVALGCGLAWFAISIWGAASLAARMRRSY